MSTLTIHRTKPTVIDGQQVISVRFNANQKTGRKATETFITLPKDHFTGMVSTIPEGEQKAFLMAVLNDLALRRLRKAGPDVQELGESQFTFEGLRSFFEDEAASDWPKKEDLEKDFVASATYKKFTSRPQWAASPQYRKLVEGFKDDILLACARNAGYMDPAKVDQIVSKLEAEDIESDWCSFVVKRLTSLTTKDKPEAPDYDAL